MLSGTLVPTAISSIPAVSDLPPREKVKTFPTTPGVYLMKDSVGRVIYVGKAINLRSRASSYFTKIAAEELRTANLVLEICDIDFIPSESEIDALLLEARLIKDIQPRFNTALKDDKTIPYLEIFVREEFPRVEFTRKPQPRGTRLYGPFLNSRQLRGAIVVLQQVFRFRTCSLKIKESEERWRWFRPCLLASLNQCTAPCNLRISREEYRHDIRRLRLFLEGKRKRLFRELREEMLAASLRMEDAVFVEYWGESVPPTERINKWLTLADTFAKDWIPSKELFLSRQN